MKDKIQVQQKGSVYTFRASQILRADVRGFLMKFDPVRLPNRRVEELFGRVVIRFEGIPEIEVPTHPELRPLLRRLHAIWPWSGYFLNLEEPLGPAAGINKKPLQAFGLCLADLKLAIRRERKTAFFEVGPQLWRFHENCHEVIDHIGKRTSFSAQTLQARHEAVRRQFNDVLT